MKKIKSKIINRIHRMKGTCILWIPFFIREPKVAYSYLFTWIDSTKFPKKQYALPWMTFGSIDWFEKNINKDSKIFEWGTGGSTLYWAKKAEHVWSIEHDTAWCEHLTRILANTGLKNYDYALIRPENADNRNFLSNAPEYKGQSFEKYCRTIESFPDNYFNIISIDGRARVACAKVARAKVKDNGYIVLDNAEREEYLPIFTLLKDWKIIRFKGPGLYNFYPWETVVFQKTHA